MSETKTPPEVDPHEKARSFSVGTLGGAEKIKSPRLVKIAELEQLVFRPAYEQGLASIEFQIDEGDGKASSICSYTVAFETPESCFIWSHFPPDSDLEPDWYIDGSGQKVTTSAFRLKSEDGERHSRVLHEVLTPLIEKFGNQLMAEKLPAPEVLSVDINQRIKSVRDMSQFRVTTDQ